MLVGRLAVVREQPFSKPPAVEVDLDYVNLVRLSLKTARANMHDSFKLV